MGDRYKRSDINEILIGFSTWDTVYRYWIRYIDVVSYLIDIVIRDIDIGYVLMIWVMTISIRLSSVSILDILSLCPQGRSYSTSIRVLDLNDPPAGTCVRSSAFRRAAHSRCAVATASARRIRERPAKTARRTASVWRCSLTLYAVAAPLL
jgi:hypothetical protein